MSKIKNYGQDVQSWITEVTTFIEQNQLAEPAVFDTLNRLLQRSQQLQVEGATEDDMRMLEQELDYAYQEISDCVNQSMERQNSGQSVPIGKHILPPLLYPYDALEPVISEEIMHLHHAKHHQAYVDGLNKAEKMMLQARETNDFALLKHWEREVAFHGSGHYLHTIFWEVMSPNGGGQPKGSFLKQVETDFGSFTSFKKHFSEAAKQVEAVGWAILVWAPRARRLEILQSERHMILTQWDTIPILVLDVWEHAYYLQYKNNRGKYVDQWWNVVYWPQVERRFQDAKKIMWKAY